MPTALAGFLMKHVNVDKKSRRVDIFQ
jgi:hypothetical protein